MKAKIRRLEEDNAKREKQIESLLDPTKVRTENYLFFIFSCVVFFVKETKMMEKKTPTVQCFSCRDLNIRVVW